MQFDYYLVPNEGEFGPVALGHMRDILRELVTHQWSDDYFTVFRNAEIRSLRLPRLLADPDEPDWLDGYVKLAPGRVTLGLVQDDEMRRQFYQFAVRSMELLGPMRLVYAGKGRPLSKLLPPEA